MMTSTLRELSVSYAPRTIIDAVVIPESLTTPRAVASVLMPLFVNELVEVVGILCLTTKHAPICWHVVSRGSLDRCLAGAREVFRAAILANAASIIVAHNHPSGDPAPSPDDLAIADRLSRAGDILGIHVDDFLIVAGNRYYSTKENGR